MYPEPLTTIREVCPRTLQRELGMVVRDALFLDAAELRNAHDHGLLDAIAAAAQVQKDIEKMFMARKLPDALFASIRYVTSCPLVLMAVALLRSQDVDFDAELHDEHKTCQLLNHMLATPIE